MFELARYSDGRVVGADNYAPAAGDTVWLQKHGDELVVHEAGSAAPDGRVVRFQWPPGRLGVSARKAWLAYVKACGH